MFSGHLYTILLILLIVLAFLAILWLLGYPLHLHFG